MEETLENSPIIFLYADKKTNITFYKISNYESELFFGVRIFCFDETQAEIISMPGKLKEDALTIIDIFFENYNITKLYPNINYVFTYYGKQICERRKCM